MAADEPRDDDIPDDLFEIAVRWHARLRETDVTPQIREKFQRWFDADELHARAYHQAEHLWQALGKPAGDAAGENEESLETLISRAKARKSSLRRTTTGLAIAALAAGGFWWHGGGFDDLRATYVTAPGAQHHYVLADGTSVDLNTDTSLAIDMQPDRRCVRMFRGEAYFTVAHDGRRPFVVETRDGSTWDVGTAFNVRVKNDQTLVSLIEGKVTVSAEGHTSRTDLNPGEQVEISSDGIGKVERFQTESAAAWRNGQMVFFQTPLGEVVDELNRYGHGHIILFGGRLRGLPVTGVFSTRNPADAIKVIEATLGVSAIHITGALTVIR